MDWLWVSRVWGTIRRAPASISKEVKGHTRTATFGCCRVDYGWVMSHGLVMAYGLVECVCGDVEWMCTIGDVVIRMCCHEGVSEGML